MQVSSHQIADLSNDEAEAEADADADIQRLIDEEIEVLRSSSSGPHTAEAALHLIKRILIRCCWIAFGLLILFGAFLTWSYGSEVLDTPFAAMTLRDLGKVLGASIWAVFLAILAFRVAFSEIPPDPPEGVYSLREEAEAIVRSRLNQLKLEAAKARAEENRTLQWYRYGKAIGMLFDPVIAKRHRWLPWVAFLGCCVLLFGGLVVIDLR